MDRKERDNQTRRTAQIQLLLLYHCVKSRSLSNLFDRGLEQKMISKPSLFLYQFILQNLKLQISWLMQQPFDSAKQLQEANSERQHPPFSC
jgi:hypothetical protein